MPFEWILGVHAASVGCEPSKYNYYFYQNTTNLYNTTVDSAGNTLDFIMKCKTGWQSR